MRVIAGKARHLNLKTIEGNDTRPTTDRIKETLFNMINNRLYGIRFLDLFAGSGAIGIEALSRGAEYACFVENNAKAVKCIKENLKFTKLDGLAELMKCDVFTAVTKLDGKPSFDIIFMDPPYNKMLEKEVLLRLKDTTLVNEDTLIIVEASLETDFDYLKECGYNIVKIKNYKTNKHMFIERQNE